MPARATWTMSAATVPKAEQRWARLDRAIKEGVNAGLILLQSKIRTDFLSGDPVHRRTGNLSRAIFYDPTSIDAMSAYRGVVGVGKEAPYAKWVNDGSDAHVITAHGTTLDRAAQSGLDVSGIWTREKMLRFKIGGETFYRAEVFHPGTTATHFMEKALKANKAAIVKGIQTRAVRALMVA